MGMTTGIEAHSSRGVVAANPPAAAEIGARIFEAGGNAMDAASAASMACCMLAPGSTGVGGYVCAALVLEGKTGSVWCVDANSIAPAAAHERMYELQPTIPQRWEINETEYECSVKDDANVYGPLSVGPPGMMAGMGTVWERWGRLKWPEIVAPSLKLISDGFPYANLADSITMKEAAIRRFPETVKHLMPTGKLPKREDIWHRPDMEKTLERVAQAGWRDFYDGEIGHKIADYIRKSGGILTRQDMAEYKPRLTDPYTTTYRDATVHGTILTNGALTTLQILNMLECLELPADDTADYWHLYAEVLKLAWRDRLRYVADPDFVAVPIQRLLDKGYAAGRVESIRQFPRHVDRLQPVGPPELPPCTLHVATADADGNVVSMTISQGGSFGSCVTVPGTGIILGHGMCRLDPRPGRANSIAPRKRPLNNTSSLILQLPERDVGIGVPGGRYIIAVMARAAHLLVDRGWTAHQAAIAPRMHTGEREPVWLTKSAGEKMLAEVRALGHEVNPIEEIAGCINGAEFLRKTGKLRAGSGISAAGARDAA